MVRTTKTDKNMVLKTQPDTFEEWELNELDNGMILDFVDDQSPISHREASDKASEVLEQYGFEEILEENGMDETEALALLYEHGYIGLPEFIDYDDEEVSGLPDEEEFDS